MYKNRTSDDLIRVDDAVSWINWVHNPANLSVVGEELLGGMVTAAVDAVRKGGKDGTILRRDAVACINSAIPESAPAEMDSYRKSKWGTVRAMIRETMAYPDRVSPN
jgi:hypothetical protein